MSEHRKALEEIMRECASSRTYTRRVQCINNIAMKALGMTANQRHAVHMQIMDRIGDETMKERYLKRREKADARFAMFMEETHGVRLAPVVQHLEIVEPA